MLLLEDYQALHDKKKANNQVRANYRQQYIYFLLCIFGGNLFWIICDVENKQNFLQDMNYRIYERGGKEMKRTPPEVSSDGMVNFELKGVEETKE